MTNLLVIKEHLKNIYSKYEAYFYPLIKLLLAIFSFMLINSKLGYMKKIDNVAVVMVAALLCSFLPINFIIVISAVIILLHIYALSLEAAAIVLIVLTLMFLLYFRFAPKETLAVLLTPICFILKIPYAVPLTMGLVGTPVSAVSVGCGIVVYQMLEFIKANDAALGSGDSENAMAKFRMLIDGIINNKSMLVMLAAFTLTIFVVYLIRRLSFDHAWTIAIGAGIVVNVVTLFIGDLIYDINLSMLEVLLGGLISACIVKLIQFFAFNLDYTRTENVQFEDDEYYYYVKAVPKITVATPDKNVKKINTPKKKSTGGAKPVQKLNSSSFQSPIDRSIDRNVEKAAGKPNNKK